MKSITFTRVMIAIVLLYFPVATVGSTGSYVRGLEAFVLLLMVLYLGFAEGCRRTPTDPNSGRVRDDSAKGDSADSQ